jgi:hypothetical protein
MPESPFQTAGAQIEPSSAAPLHTNEFFTGMWTQGNPLGPGAVPYLYQKFYSASRYDRLLGGKNVEISTRLTLIRRPGNPVYNPGPIPPVNRFYEFRSFQGRSEQIHIMASCDPASGSTHGTVRDVTGPANNITLWTKDPSAGRTCFLSVGNVLYFSDGVDAKKWVTSGKAWAANTQFAPGDFILDTNNNLQLSIGAQTANLVNIQVESLSSPAGARKVTLYFDPGKPLSIKSNIALTLAGLTTVPSLNGTTPYTAVVESSLKVHFVVIASGGNPPVTAYSTETGTASTGTGITGATQPVWNATVSLATQDGGEQWINMGTAIEGWGADAPANPPTVTQTAAPSIYPNWAANTWYAPSFVILDSNNNLQRLTTAGVTGGAAPAWNVTTGGTTADGTCVWTNLGASAWVALTAYAVGNSVMVTFTYTINVTTGQSVPYPPYYILTTTQQQITVTQTFTCITAGTSGANAPAWSAGLGTQVTDGTVVWVNSGSQNAWPGATQTLSMAKQVIDGNGYIEKPQQLGESGATAPTWPTTAGSMIGDGSQEWLNAGPYSQGNTAPWIWAYSGKNSITGHIGTASPLSQPLTVGLGKFAVIQGQGLADPQYDTIVLWRTVQGGSLLMYDDEFPNPGAGQTWIYTDTNADPSSTTTPQQGQLNFLITAPINSTNAPPPVGFLPQCYYLNRIWGWMGNILVWSGGPDVVTGNGNESFAPLNQIPFPSLGVTCWPTSVGLICFTQSDVWAVLGKGTSDSPFYVVNFQEGIGLASQDAFCVNGSTAYAMLVSGQLVSMDPGAGETEVGFPIGDQFDSLYVPANTYCAWHQGASRDMALYVADGSQGWHRMAAVAAPESGNVWSNRALIEGGVKAIASLEISPGIRRLLLGPTSDGPILMRDLTANRDNITPYDAIADIGSIQLAQPGLFVGVQFITSEEKAIAGASPLSIGVLFDEIEGTFNTLRNVVPDPPNLPRSKSLISQRCWISQDPDTVQVARHMQVELSWPAENFPNELLTYTIYGRLPTKARK